MFINIEENKTKQKNSIEPSSFNQKTDIEYKY